MVADLRNDLAYLDVGKISLLVILNNLKDWVDSLRLLSLLLDTMLNPA